MFSKPDAHATFARMERACVETARQLDTIDRQIAARAAHMVVTARTKARQFGRGTSTWTPPDNVSTVKSALSCASSAVTGSRR